MVNRVAILSRFLAVVSLAAIAFPIVFLFTTSAFKILRPESRVDHVVRAEVPIIFVLFDDLPLPALMDQDGHIDLYVSNMFSSAGGRIAYQRRFQETAPDQSRAYYQRLARGNTLFKNNGDGSFSDVSETAGVTMGRWAWGALALDFNNDGFEDLFVPNGFITNDSADDL